MRPLAARPMRKLPVGSGPANAQQAPRSLPVRIYGSSSSATPVLLLHGFTQTSASWGAIAEPLSGMFPVLVPDLPGHGGASHLAADLWETADLLAATLGSNGAERANWVGYSMGGRAALHLAFAHPHLVSKLVLVSTSAGIDGAGERAARRLRDEELAQRIESGGDERLHEFFAEWLSQPLFATLSPERAGLDERLRNTASGLATSLRTSGAGAQEPLWHRLPELGKRRLPVLLIVGELDTAYRNHAGRMAQAIGPSASVVVVPGSGHACHLEHPELVVAELSRFCSGAAS